MEKRHFAELLDNKTAEFVEEELKPHLGALMTFVNTSELEKDLKNVAEDKFDKVAGEFNNSWKNAIGNLNSSVMNSFPNFQNGSRILDSVLARFLGYYTRYLQFWERKFVHEGSVNKRPKVQPVGMQMMMIEIKKFRSNF